MKTFYITCDQKFTVWQNNLHKIKANSKEEAIEILKENPSEYCVNTETLVDTEEHIETDFSGNFEIEKRLK